MSKAEEKESVSRKYWAWNFKEIFHNTCDPGYKEKRNENIHPVKSKTNGHLCSTSTLYPETGVKPNRKRITISSSGHKEILNSMNRFSNSQHRAALSCYKSSCYKSSFANLTSCIPTHAPHFFPNLKNLWFLILLLYITKKIKGAFPKCKLSGWFYSILIV